MRMKRVPSRAALLAIASASVMALSATAHAEILRMAAWNIEADIDGDTGPLPGLPGVLEGIGEETIGSDGSIPLDILTLEETTSKVDTINPIVNDLNSFYSSAALVSKYGTNVYATPSFEASTSGGYVGDGNGPNDIIYNSSVLNLISAKGVGNPGASGSYPGGGAYAGEYRQVALYEFQPISGPASSAFYVFVMHAKSGTTNTDATDRNDEAEIVRNYEAANLPSNARVIYAGDLNTSASTDASYETFTAADSPSDVAQGQGFDPLDEPGNWDENNAFQQGSGAAKGVLTESTTDIRYRDDFQLQTQNVYEDQSGGLEYVDGTYQAFGNNGSVAEGHDVSGSTALSGLPTSAPADGEPDSSQVISDLQTASDHFPVVADYTEVVPEPASLATMSFGVIGMLLLGRRKKSCASI
jgi:PEP-CTERM motif